MVNMSETAIPNDVAPDKQPSGSGASMATIIMFMIIMGILAFFAFNMMNSPIESCVVHDVAAVSASDSVPGEEGALKRVIDRLRDAASI